MMKIGVKVRLVKEDHWSVQAGLVLGGIYTVGSVSGLGGIITVKEDSKGYVCSNQFVKVSDSGDEIKKQISTRYTILRGINL